MLFQLATSANIGDALRVYGVIGFSLIYWFTAKLSVLSCIQVVFIAAMMPYEDTCIDAYELSHAKDNIVCYKTDLSSIKSIRSKNVLPMIQS